MTQIAPSFQERLNVGRVGESDIARWLIGRGWSVLPVYEIELSRGKGPRVFSGTGDLIAPDMMAFRGGELKWIEAKHKTVFSWYRIGSVWETGVDQRHFNDYVRVAERYPWEIWLMFLHRSTQPSESDLKGGCPSNCPAGLFGGRLLDLKTKINHASDKWGNSGMVYWKHSDLLKISGYPLMNGNTLKALAA